MKTVTLLFFAIFLSCSNIQAEQMDLGPLNPQQAAQYMERHPEAIIVDVASRGNYEKRHFPGAVNIPIENMSQQDAERMYMELPTGKPVIMHCRLGMIVPRAYRDLKRLRPDIPEISYIDGKPPFDDVNTGENRQR